MNFSNILFLDIETVPQYPDYAALPDRWKALWNVKAASLLRGRDGEGPESVYERAGIYAEFGKIVCVSCGCLQGEGTERRLRLKSYYGHEEAELLRGLADTLQRHWSGPDKMLCAHNGKEFDFPYLCRRFVINGVPIPEPLLIAGRKPWEIRHLDTMEMWKFGDFKNYTSLNLIAAALGVPSPKDDIDGSQVGPVYWKDGDLERIRTYCQKDVATLAQVLLRYHCQPLVPEEAMMIVS
ncbi:MAG: 3'-5' exonuclease [Chitinophagaceae bacterium]|nr:MAG: 3'-5' exonuclease [Chitinophagaceae bacterium]